MKEFSLRSFVKRLDLEPSYQLEVFFSARRNADPSVREHHHKPEVRRPLQGPYFFAGSNISECESDREDSEFAEDVAAVGDGPGARFVVQQSVSCCGVDTPRFPEVPYGNGPTRFGTDHVEATVL